MGSCVRHAVLEVCGYVDGYVGVRWVSELRG